MPAMAGNSKGQLTSSSKGKSTSSSKGGMSDAQMYEGASGVFGALGAYGQGRYARAIGRLRKKEYERSAKQAVAVAQRQMLAEQKNAELLASRAVAVAAAGGGNADDPTVNKIIADIDAEGAYRAAVALYDGEEAARNLKYQGKLAKAAGDAAYEAGKTKAVMSLINTGASMAKYG